MNMLNIPIVRKSTDIRIVLADISLVPGFTLKPITSIVNRSWAQVKSLHLSPF